MERARATGFESVSIDLIYGLPKQTPESFAFTLKRVAELSPDRLSVFNYAHLPDLFAAQRKIKDEDLPSAEQKLTILQQTIENLTGSGYQFIGMDHFAKPDDELAVAQNNGILHRNLGTPLMRSAICWALVSLRSACWVITMPRTRKT